jgi:hypothetical protein
MQGRAIETTRRNLNRAYPKTGEEANMRGASARETGMYPLVHEDFERSNMTEENPGRNPGERRESAKARSEGRDST